MILETSSASKQIKKRSRNAKLTLLSLMAYRKEKAYF